MVEPKVFTQTPTAKKRYYSQVAGSRFITEDGTEIQFRYGFADIDILEHQKELDKILGKNPVIYIPEKLPEKLPEVPQNAKSEAEIAAAEAALRGTIGKVSGDANLSATPGVPTDPNASAVDKDLQAAVFGGAEPIKKVSPENAIKAGAAASVSMK